MRSPLVAAVAVPVIRAALLAGPVLLAFRSGGFFDGARAGALAVAAVVVLLVAVAAPVPLPRRAPARVALLALGLLAAWTALGLERSPLEDAAADDVERLLLYVAALLAGVAAWRSRTAARVAEVGVAAGTVVVSLYALQGRLLPWLAEQSASAAAGGRLEQPLTYWNAQGALAALGAVLCTRIAGDETRAAGLRAAAAAATVPLVLALYLTFSRGAVLALACGLLVLLACAPTRAQVRAALIGLEAAAPAVVAATLVPEVRGLDGGPQDGPGALVALVVLAGMAAATLLTLLAVRDARDGRLRGGRLPLPARGTAAAVTAACVAAVLVPVLVTSDGADEPAFGAQAQRFADVGSDRGAYWEVALDAFADDPVRGLGPGGFAIAWQRERELADGVRDAHSLPLETAAELGLVGLVLLLAFLAAVARAAREVGRADPVLAAGASAGLAVLAVHASLDWDWELPALTLPGLTLAALLLARADARAGTPPPRA